MQAKPYINEAHVFNDAGLSFDVWPPSNSNIQDEFTASLTQACNAEQQQAEDGQSSTDNQQCSTRGCSSGSCGAFSAQSYLSSRDHTGPVCKDGSNSTCQASAQSEAGSADVGRGYLLAAKLWQEALLTLAASASDQKP